MCYLNVHIFWEGQKDLKNNISQFYVTLLTLEYLIIPHCVFIYFQNNSALCVYLPCNELYHDSPVRLRILERRLVHVVFFVILGQYYEILGWKFIIIYFFNWQTDKKTCFGPIRSLFTYHHNKFSSQNIAICCDNR